MISQKCIWKYCLRNVGQFVNGGDTLIGTFIHDMRGLNSTSVDRLMKAMYNLSG